MSSEDADLDPDFVIRVSAELREMPGLRLTEAQACRLWGVEPGSCGAVIAALIAAGVVRRTPGGTLARRES